MGLNIHRLSGVAFTNIDDLQMGHFADRIRAEGFWAPYSELANGYSLGEGRVYFWVSMLFFVSPFLVRSLLVRAVLSALVQLGAAGSIAAVVGQYAGWRVALVAIALASAWLPYWMGGSPVIGYPFAYHAPVILFFGGLALWILLARGRVPGRWRWAVAAIAWTAIFLSLFSYESLLPPFLLVAMAAAAMEVRRRGDWSRAAVLRSWLPWFACFSLWAAIYLVYRWLHPSIYTGSALTAVGRGELRSTLLGLFYFETYALPGSNWVGTPHLPSLGHSLTAGGIILAALVAAMVIFWALDFRKPDEAASRRGFGRMAALAVVCAVISPLPLALTSKYRLLYAEVGPAPCLSGYHAYLAWCMAAALAFPLVALALRRPRWRWTAILSMATLSAAAAAANTITDDAIAQRFTEWSEKWRLLEAVGDSGWFASLPANSVVLAPDLWSDGFPVATWDGEEKYWSTYFSQWAGRRVRGARSEREIPELLRRGTPVFYCGRQWLPGRSSAVLAIEPVTAISPAGEAVSDSAVLATDADPGGMALQYRSAEEEAPSRAALPQWRHTDGAWFARVAAPGLLAGTAELRDPQDTFPAAPLLEFGRGFSVAEHDPHGPHYWRWSDGPDGAGELDLYNPSPRTMAVRFRAMLQFHADRTAFDFLLPQGSETITATPDKIVERTWRLAPGANRVVVKCHAGRMPTPGDSRYIVFGLRDWSLVPVGE